MKILEFNNFFPDEQSCRERFKLVREKQGIVCRNCGSSEHRWVAHSQRWECRCCRFRTSLRSGTVMHGSKLSFLYWFKAIHLMSCDKSGISALALQKELGHKRYEPIWTMMHKLRSIMGQRDNKYKMDGTFEMDEAAWKAFFEHVILDKEERERVATEGPKRGTSSEEKSKVLVMVGSEPVTDHDPKKHDKKRRCGFIKMRLIPDLKAATIEEKVSGTVEKSANVVTDASNSYVNLKTILKSHTAYNLPSKGISKALPWVHTAISNAKRKLEGTFYMVSDKYIGYYLDEFCYMFNRKPFKCKFDRLIIAAAAIKHDFDYG